MIVSRDGSSAFSIHDSHIDVTIPFDREVMALMPRIGTNDGTIPGADSSSDMFLFFLIARCLQS